MADYAQIVASANQVYANAVMQDTWGHLAPQKNTSYKCKILFFVSEFGGDYSVPVMFEFEHGLDSSPWLYDSVCEMISKFKCNMNRMPGIYLLEGTFRNFRFYGTPKLVFTI